MKRNYKLIMKDITEKKRHFSAKRKKERHFFVFGWVLKMNRQHRKCLILFLAKKWIDIRRKKEKNLKRLQLIYFNSYFQNMRKLKLVFIMLMKKKQRRRIWAYGREERWFDELWDNRFNNAFLDRWRSDFRMSGVTSVSYTHLTLPTIYSV